MTLEHVPSHIVAPSKKKKDAANGGMESMLSRPSSNRSSKPKPRRQKYAEVKQEMMASNRDPSRDVLQTMLNPYDGFDTERQPVSLGPFPRKVSKAVGQSNMQRRSEMLESDLTSNKPVSKMESEKALKPMMDDKTLNPMRSKQNGNQSLQPSTF